MVSPAKLRPDGRRVRCARCGHDWFEEAPPPDLEDAPELMTIPAAEGDQETSGADTAEPENPEKETDETTARGRRDLKARRADGGRRRGSNLPALPGNHRRLSDILGWAGLALFILVVVGGGYIFRDAISNAWPPSKRLYDALGIEAEIRTEEPRLAPLSERLTFSDLKPSQQFVGGVLTLIIEGRINNVGPVAETLPPVEVVLLDNRQLDLTTWLVEPPQRRLGPGQSVTFETRLENPPAAAQDIRVTFAAGNGG